ncbi:C40 family peptidase [Neisseria sp. 27098_8_112]|uniref:C40 family peptidase n=1 Tax=unclassified Neisseria TaxID=2623750 RepID=UPI00352D345A
MIEISDEIQDLIFWFADGYAPQEMCGAIADIHDKGRRFFAIDNIAENPEETFEMNPKGWQALAADGEIVAVVHSHPNGEPFLSGADRQMQIQTGLPWILAVGGRLKQFRCCPHLRGRVFEYGKADCGALIRDAFMLMGIDLPDHTRGDIDDDAEHEYLRKHFERVGFVRVSDGLRGGDVILTSYGGHANHAALYLGDGQILHHAYNQLSRREPFNQWWSERVHSVWRLHEFEPEMLQAVENDLLHSVDL